MHHEFIVGFTEPVELFLIFIEDPDDSDTYYDTAEIDKQGWYIIPGDTPQIHFIRPYIDINSDRDGLKLRIIGQQKQDVLSADTDTCELPPEYVVQMATSIILQEEGKLDEAAFAKNEAERLKNAMKVIPVGRAVYGG